MPVASIIGAIVAGVSAVATAASGAGKAAATNRAGREAFEMHKEELRKEKLDRLMLGRRQRAEAAATERALDIREREGRQAEAALKEQRGYNRYQDSMNALSELINKDQNLKNSYINKFMARR